MDFSGAYLLDAESGSALSVKHQRIADIISDYDPSLELAWIPPRDRTAFDKEPFAIVHNMSNGNRYVVMTVPEDEVDERLVAKLFMINNVNGNVLDRVEALDAAARVVKLKEKMERDEEARELAHSVLRSQKSVYRHNGVVYR